MSILKNQKADKTSYTSIYLNYKRGLIFNILSVVCIVAFFVCFAIEHKTMSKELIIVGCILGGLFAILSICLLIRTIVKITKLKKL